MLRTLVAVVVLALCSVSFAGSKAPFKRHKRGSVEGFGSASCGAYVAKYQELKRGDDFANFFVGSHVAFASGYVLGANDYTRGRHDLHYGVDVDSISLFLYNYCAANPLSRTFHAAGALVDELSKKR